MFRILSGVTYASFLAACRRLAGFENKSEFARDKLKLKVNHYIGAESGRRRPGRKLLEAAARAAGFEFEDCIQLPVAEKVTDELQNTLDQFKALLFDPLNESAARLAVLQLMATAKKSDPAGRKGRKPKKQADR